MFTGLWAPFNSLLIKYMIDSVELATEDNVLSLVFVPAVLFVLNYEIHNICWRAMGYLNYKYEPVIKNQIISETFGHIHKHTYQFFQDNLAGRIAGQINILANNVENIVHDISRHFLRFIVLLVVTFISMYSVDPKFFYALLTWLIVFVCFSLSRSRRIISLSQAHAFSESTVLGQLVDSITNASNELIACFVFKFSRSFCCTK
jgi:ATP-binding cassette subfamily B protein